MDRSESNTDENIKFPLNGIPQNYYYYIEVYR